MDPDSPIARVERTFWNVWNYITVAVNRFLRPVPTDIVSNEPNSLQESAVDSEPANCGHTAGDTCRGQVDEEQGLAAASLLSSSRPVVAWELCTTEINLGHDEESSQDKTQLSRGSESKASEEGDGLREEQFTQSGNDGTGLLSAENTATKEDEQEDSRGSERKSSEEDDDMTEEQFTQSGNDNAGLLIAKGAGPKEDEQEENKGWKLDIPERDTFEGHANTVSLNAADDAMSEDIQESGRKESDEEESGRAMTQEDPQKMDETVTNIQIQGEHSEMQCEVEHDYEYSHTVCSVEAEETEVKLCTLTDLSFKEDATCVEAETAVTPEEVENSDGVLQLASGNENNRQAENLLSVCEELSDVDRDVEGGPNMVSSDTTLMAYDKSVILSDDEQIVEGQEQVMLERTERIMYDIAEDEKEEEDESAVEDEEHGVVIKEENVNELAGTINNKTSDEVPEQENDIETVTEDNQEEDITTECVACSEDFTQTATTELYKAEFTDGKQEHVAEDTEVQTKTRETDDVEIKSHGAVNDEKSDVNKAEAEQERFSNEDDNNEGCMEIACATAAVTVKPDGEAGQEISGGFKNIPPGIFESGVEAEKTEVKLCTLTDLSLKEDATGVGAGTAVTPDEAENSDGVLQLTSENENNRQAENLLSVCEELSDVDRDLEWGPSMVSSDITLMAYDKSVILSDDEQIVEGQKQVMLERTERIMYDIAEDEKEEEDESAVEDEEHGVVIKEENVNELAGTINNKTSDEVPEQENDIETVTEDNQEEDITTECVACSEDFTQNATTELYKAEFTDGEQEHVAEDTEVQTKSRETDDVEIKSHGAVNDEKSDGNKAEAEQERLSNEDDNNEGCMEIACATAAVTVKPDGEAGQEISGEFKNIPPGIFESGVEAEKTEVKLCTLTDLSLKEDATGVGVGTAVTPDEVENSDGVLQLASENENNRQAENLLSVCEELSDVDRDLEWGPSMVSSDTTLMAYDKSVILSDDEQIVEGQDQVMLERTERIMYDIAEDEKEEDESAVEDEEHGVVIMEENINELAGTTNNKTSDDVPEQENDIETVTEDNQEEDITTECVACSEDFTQTATTELYKGEFTDGEQEHVAEDTEVQTKTRETDDVEIKSHGAVNDEKSDVNKAEAEQERPLNEYDNNEGCLEIACATAAVTVKPDGEVGQEISGEFKNIPPGIFEGQTVVSQQLNSTTCEEAQEGVPEYNNEPGPYENTTQRILEGGDDEVIQTTQLPEEVECEEPKSLQNSGSSSDYLLLKERMEEEQDSRLTTEDSSFDEDARILSITDAKELEKPLAEPVIQESGHLPVQKEGQLLDSSMKTGISEKEFETHIGSANNNTTKELQDGTEEFFVEFEVDEGLWDSREADAAGGGHEATGAAEEVARFADETLKLLDGEAQKIGFYEESENAINSNVRTFSLMGDVAEPGFLKQPFETEPKLLEDHTAETQDAWTGMEETSYGFEEKVAEDEMQSKNDTEILNCQVVELATELTTDTDKKESALIAGLESSTHIKADAHVKTLDTQVQLSEEALEEILTDTETAEESMRTELEPKHSTEMSPEDITKQESDGNYTEETGSPVRGRRDVIEEEILDLWIQAALSDETVDTKQQEQKMDTEMEPPNEEQDEIHSEKEHLVESNSPESGLVSDSEISSSTAESGILDQSFGEWGTQNSETWLLKSASTESFQGIDHIFASMPASTDISELSIKQQAFEPQDLLIEVTAEAGQSYLKDEELITVTDQESDKLQEKTEEERAESVEVGAASQKYANVMPKTTSPLAVDHTNVEDEPLEISVSDSLNDIISGQSRSGSEDSLEDGIVLTDSGLQGETCFEMKLPSLDEPQVLWSEDITEPSSGLIGAEVAQQPWTKSEGQMEVNAPVLDFTAQRSRIAVKNRYVRPPKDPRSLLNMPSVDPTPSTRLPVKVPAGVPLGGRGIGIKLPGLGAGFPVLKKTQRVVRDENNPATSSQESEKKPEEKDDTPKQDEVQQKPKWMPPRHPGFGNPLMSELKTKLKKPTKD
ncbi:uncharacterized protein si:ch211-180a12.2 [Scomber scombrus]|uniref:Uncharacterized protein si:ch211-180a12.2 n=1 Tax=Scomber scombrus TaxID=13677 RepID=A0AAV1PH53_SCOSC